MADTFYREPTNHGDNNNYHDYVMLQLRCGGRGGLTMELYDSGGTLYLSAGYAGIDDGVTKGTVERTAAGALSIAAISVGTWCKVEVSVSGAAVTYTVSDIAGAVTEHTIPPTVVAAYDYRKAGYYLTASKRIIGLAYKTAAGNLGRIVNPNSNHSGFFESPVNTFHAQGAIETDSNIDADGNMIAVGTVEAAGGVRAGSAGDGALKEKTVTYIINAWDMDTVQIHDIVITETPSQIKEISAIIWNDAGDRFYDIYHESAVYGTGTHGISQIAADTIRLAVKTGGFFDSADFNDGGADRGILTIRYYVP